MAIIDGVPGLEVQILVDGEPLIEYDDEDEPGVHDGSGRKTISKFVEARSGAEFVIKCSFDAVNPYKTNDLQIAVYIDGKYMDDRVLYARQIQAPYISRLSGHRYRTGSQFFQRKFSFSELSIVENHNQKPTDDLVLKLKQTGLISVRICRIVVEGERVHGFQEKSLDSVGEISEKALKGRALSHAVSLKPKQSIEKVLLLKVQHIDSEHKPLLAYDFKYLSEERLRGLCIIPRSASPVPLEDRDVSTLSMEELRELARRQQEKIATQHIKTEIKRERADDDGVEIGEIRPVKRRIMEAIDLTDD